MFMPAVFHENLFDDFFDLAVSDTFHVSHLISVFVSGWVF